VPFVPHCSVFTFLHRLRAERPQDIVNDAMAAVVLFIIVGSTILLLVSDASIAFSGVGSAVR
jgi:hypothetical protein